MWRADPTAMFGMFTGIVLGLGFFALIAYLVYLFVYKRIQMNHQIRLEMIKQGMPLPIERESYGSLKAGIVSAMIGIGFLVVIAFNAIVEGRTPEGEIVLGVIPFCVGAGLIIFHLIARKAFSREGQGGRYLSDPSES